MKVMRLILCIVIALSLCSCGFFGETDYFCPIDEVKSVKIVRYGEYIVEEQRHNHVILVEIPDYYSFIERLNNIDCRVNWGEPRVFYEDYIAIRIDYINGDFDLINDRAQSFFRNGEKQTGFLYFDEEQFDSLIEDYLR